MNLNGADFFSAATFRLPQSETQGAQDPSVDDSATYHTYGSNANTLNRRMIEASEAYQQGAINGVDSLLLGGNYAHATAAAAATGSGMPQIAMATSGYPNTALETQYVIGLDGWKKLLFYLLIACVTLMTIINAGLNLWMLTVLDFSFSGIGRLKFTPDGLKLAHGDAYVLSQFHAKNIRSSQAEKLRISSPMELNLRLQDAKNSDKLLGQVSIGGAAAAIDADRFVLRNAADGRLLLLINENDVVLSTEQLQIENPNKMVFNTSIQTPLVQSVFSSPGGASAAAAGSDPLSPPIGTEYELPLTPSDGDSSLNIESLTREVKVFGPKGVSMESRSGALKLAASKGVNIVSRRGQVALDASAIYLPNLQTAFAIKEGMTYNGIYQICSCPNGQLYMAAPEGHCSAPAQDSKICDQPQVEEHGEDAGPQNTA